MTDIAVDRPTPSPVQRIAAWVASLRAVAQRRHARSEMGWPLGFASRRDGAG